MKIGHNRDLRTKAEKKPTGRKTPVRKKGLLTKAETSAEEKPVIGRGVIPRRPDLDEVAMARRVFIALEDRRFDVSFPKSSVILAKRLFGKGAIEETYEMPLGHEWSVCQQREKWARIMVFPYKQNLNANVAEALAAWLVRHEEHVERCRIGPVLADFIERLELGLGDDRAAWERVSTEYDVEPGMICREWLPREKKPAQPAEVTP